MDEELLMLPPENIGDMDEELPEADDEEEESSGDSEL
jgi:hypothetical protein